MKGYPCVAIGPTEIVELAQVLDQALLGSKESSRLTERKPELSLEDAYRIQDAGIRLRSMRGEKQVGLKMGLTSKAKRDQMGLTSAIYGVLTNSMQVNDGGVFSLRGKIHPKIEPEIAFIVGKDLGQDLKKKVTLADAFDACESVCVAAEILDSRYTGFKYFSLPDVVADNASSCSFVLSKDKLSLKDIDVSDLNISMKINGDISQSASSREISGNPLMSVVQLCDILNSRGLFVPAGSIVLAGAATIAIQLEPGMTAEVEIEKLGALSISISL